MEIQISTKSMKIRQYLIVVFKILIVLVFLALNLDLSFSYFAWWHSSSFSPLIEPVGLERLKVLYPRMVLDERQDYGVLENLVPASNLNAKSEDDITCVTHSSIDHLHRVVPLVQAWQGLVSLAVFVSTQANMNITLKVIACLREEHPQVSQNVTFHLVFPVRQMANNSDIRIDDKLSCQVLLETVSRMEDRENNFNRPDVDYPHNLLRNVGRRAARTEFVFVIDVDLIPCPGMRGKFVQFAQRERLFSREMAKHKIAYVVPVFEAVSGLPNTRNKSELLRLWDEGKIRPFYSNTRSIVVQFNTDFQRWRKLTKKEEISVGYEIPWKPAYEPYLITRNSAPFFDERFRQFGWDRASHLERAPNATETAFCLCSAGAKGMNAPGLEHRDGMHLARGTGRVRGIYETGDSEATTEDPPCTCCHPCIHLPRLRPSLGCIPRTVSRRFVEMASAKLSLQLMIAFGFGHVLNDLCAAMWFTYLLPFLHFVPGSEEKEAGLLTLVGQVADALATPVPGLPVDSLGPSGRPETADGGRRGTSSLGWAVVQISHLSLIPLLTSCKDQRTELNAIRYAFTSNIAVHAISRIILGMSTERRLSRRSGLFFGVYLPPVPQEYLKVPQETLMLPDLKIPDSREPGSRPSRNVLRRVLRLARPRATQRAIRTEVSKAWKFERERPHLWTHPEQVSYGMDAGLGPTGCAWIPGGGGRFYETREIYGVASLLGAAASILLVTSLSVAADLIGRGKGGKGGRGGQGGFVYGAMSFVDKLASGRRHRGHSVLQPEAVRVAGATEEGERGASVYAKNVSVGGCGGAAVLGLVATLSLRRSLHFACFLRPIEQVGWLPHGASANGFEEILDALGSRLWGSGG
ncbi:unnamed protein product [Darwinula stevensoni]|uniref:Beta-1,4-glucuronyltransferase 1 n=1 Tax=Darwinula stevensoni TaxID=69355 RepID=A0A7R9A3D2_9CRUS|nr:unnamed protein product [Darwinula stevensoni]CAG0887657.1 unnamed protein product [Darwinula stevensoni]